MEAGEAGGQSDSDPKLLAWNSNQRFKRFSRARTFRAVVAGNDGH